MTTTTPAPVTSGPQAPTLTATLRERFAEQWLSASAGELNADTTARTLYLANVLVGVEEALKMAAEAMKRAVAATAAKGAARAARRTA